MALNNVKEKLMGSVGNMEREISKSKGKNEITACVYRNLFPLVHLVENEDENEYLIERLNSIGSMNKQRRELVTLDAQKLLKNRFEYLENLKIIENKARDFKKVVEENSDAVNDKTFEFFVRGEDFKKDLSSLITNTYTNQELEMISEDLENLFNKIFNGSLKYSLSHSYKNVFREVLVINNKTVIAKSIDKIREISSDANPSFSALNQFLKIVTPENKELIKLTIKCALYEFETDHEKPETVRRIDEFYAFVSTLIKNQISILAEFEKLKETLKKYIAKGEECELCELKLKLDLFNDVKDIYKEIARLNSLNRIPVSDDFLNPTPFGIELSKIAWRYENKTDFVSSLINYYASQRKQFDKDVRKNERIDAVLTALEEYLDKKEIGDTTPGEMISDALQPSMEELAKFLVETNEPDEIPADLSKKLKDEIRKSEGSLDSYDSLKMVFDLAYGNTTYQEEEKPADKKVNIDGEEIEITEEDENDKWSEALKGWGGGSSGAPTGGGW